MCSKSISIQLRHFGWNVGHGSSETVQGDYIHTRTTYQQLRASTRYSIQSMYKVSTLASIVSHSSIVRTKSTPSSPVSSFLSTSHVR